MAANFPELTSFGTLLKFGLAMEEATAETAETALKREDLKPWHDDLATCAKKHKKRNKQLERLRRERLNEVVLQPITGMARETYLPHLVLPDDPAGAMETMAAAEEAAARFYEDAAGTAANVLSGLDRTFRKLAKESRTFAADLRRERT